MSKKSMKKDIALFPGYLILVMWLAFTTVAIGWIFVASVSTTREIFTNTLLSSGLHFENYVKAIVNQNLGRCFINTTLYTIVTCVGTIIVSAPAAYVLGRMEFRGHRLTKNMLVIMMSIPGIMVMIPVFTMLTKLHLTGSLLTLMIIYICLNIPFNVFFLSGFFSTIPHAIEEAGLIDGCSAFSVFWKVMLPMAQPGIITVTLFNFLGTWNEYIWALIFSSKEANRTLALGLQSILQSMTYTGDWAGLFAGVVIVFLPTFIIYIFLSEKIIAGVTAGAVKG